MNGDDTTISAEQPWLGLASFSEETRAYFHGREEEVGELCRRVQRKTLTTLFGQSGLGKTSILRAGVVPRLRAEGYCAAYVRVDYSAAAPPPAEQLKQAIFRSTADSGTWTQAGVSVVGESLWEFLHHRDDVLRDASGRTLIPLLIFDQFEEIFTLAQTDDAGRRRAAEFLEQLADLVENRPPRDLEARIEQDESIAVQFDFNRTDYRVLIALREDYLAPLESLRAKMPSITQNRMRLARMTGEQALAAVIRPGGRLVSQEVAESIVRFVAGGAELRNAEIEPSLLSLICRELNNARIAQGRKEIAADLLAGSHDAILTDFYERALTDQPAGVRKAIEDHLLTDSGHRENLAEERMLKLLAAAGAQPDAPSTLATLVNRRLLRVEDRLDLRRVELTHDVLCGVVEQSRRTRLEREAREAAERELAAQQAEAEATRTALQRARRIAVGCAVLALLAVGSAVFGIFSARRAALAEAEAVKVRTISETSRIEAEKLVVFLLDDFYEEVQPIGRIDAVASLATRTVDYYRQLPAEALTPATLRNGALARARLAQVLSALGRDNDALKIIDEAEAVLTRLRTSGDDTPDTLLATARIGLTRGTIENGRGDFMRARQAADTALAAIKPLLAGKQVPQIATAIAARIYRNNGFALSRSGNRSGAITQLAEARRLLLSLGAQNPENVVDAAELVRTNWLYGEALRNAGQAAEAVPLLREAVVIADGILARNPANRPVLRAKATALSQLSQVEADRLRYAAALDIAREATRINESISTLEPKESRNNLRVTRLYEATALAELGRWAEASKASAAAIELRAGESIGGFSLFNMARGLSERAFVAAIQGKDDDARSLLARARDAAAEHAKVNPNKIDNGLLKAFYSLTLAQIQLLRRDTSGVEAAMAEPIAAVDALRKDGPASNQQSIGLLTSALATAAEAAALQGAHARAEQHARAELQEWLRDKNPSLFDQRAAHGARVRLALALARQGKLAEANATLRPVLDFFALPAVRTSDSVLLNAEHARALFAAALANPSRRGELLAEARSLFDVLPADLRRLRNLALTGEEIEREIRRGPIATRS